MAVTVRAKNFEITPALKEHVEKRLGKITRYFDSLEEILALLSIEKDRHIVEVTVPVGGMLLRGEEATTDMYASVDLVTEKLEKQIDKYKTRIARKMRNGGFKSELAVQSSLAEADTDEFRIVKTKRFFVKPMSIEEAMLQMNLIDHDFYVFTNSETEEVNVLYRRKDGHFGLIEPEF